MTNDSLATILMNDLDSMVHRIEALDGHPFYTKALNCIHEAKACVSKARNEIHQQGMKERFAKMDGRDPALLRRAAAGALPSGPSDATY